MSDIKAIIESHFMKLTVEEIISITKALSLHFGRQIQCIVSEFSTFNQDELVVLNDVLKGMILTKENVPDILKMYEQFKDTKLP